jgi:hypothetical protein
MNRLRQTHARGGHWFGHDICNILARLDVYNPNDPFLCTLLQKLNLDSHMFYSLRYKIVSSSDSDCSCRPTQMCCLSLSPALAYMAYQTKVLSYATL